MWCQADEPGINIRTSTSANGTDKSNPSTTDMLSHPGATAIRLRVRNFKDSCLLPADTVKNFYRCGIIFSEVTEIQRVALKISPGLKQLRTLNFGIDGIF